MGGKNKLKTTLGFNWNCGKPGMKLITALAATRNNSKGNRVLVAIGTEIVAKKSRNIVSSMRVKGGVFLWLGVDVQFIAIFVNL